MLLFYRFRVDPSNQELRNYLRANHKLSPADLEFLVNQKVIRPQRPLAPVPSVDTAARAPM